MVKQQWKTEEEYKKNIIALEVKNEKSRNELYELGETVSQILDKSNLNNSNKRGKRNTPNMEQQLLLVKKELENANKLIEIYQKELTQLKDKKRIDEIDTYSDTQELLRSKKEELARLKKEVKEMSHKNKGMEYKLLEYNLKNKTKKYDQQSAELKEILNENKMMEAKIEELSHLHERKEATLQSNIQNAKTLEEKV